MFFFVTSHLLCPSSLENHGVVVCIGIHLDVSGECSLRSKVNKLWKGYIEVSMEYGESFMCTENCVKLMFLTNFCYEKKFFF